MLDPSHPITELLQEDSRYTFEAYVFVFEALNYAQNVLQMGVDTPSEASGAADEADEAEEAEEEENDPERHISGQELCEAIRVFALEQYGYMAKTVLDNWGVRETADFGEIVFNLIQIGQMRKTAQDTREDFKDVYDFDTALCRDFKITPPE